MVINKNTIKIQKCCVLQATFFALKFVGIVFVSSIISSHVIVNKTKRQYLPFLQLDVAGV